MNARNRASTPEDVDATIQKLTTDIANLRSILNLLGADLDKGTTPLAEQLACKIARAHGSHVLADTSGRPTVAQLAGFGSGPRAEELFVGQRWPEYLAGAQWLADAFTALQNRISRLEGRLEISHVYENFGGDVWGEVRLPVEDRARMPDAVACRDEVICLQEKLIERQRQRIGMLEAIMRGEFGSAVAISHYV